jgi:hypothetical protein
MVGNDDVGGQLVLGEGVELAAGLGELRDDLERAVGLGCLAGVDGGIDEHGVDLAGIQGGIGVGR